MLFINHYIFLLHFTHAKKYVCSQAVDHLLPIIANYIKTPDGQRDALNAAEVSVSVVLVAYCVTVSFRLCSVSSLIRFNGNSFALLSLFVEKTHSTLLLTLYF